MSNGDATTADELTQRIDRLERELAKLLSERETVLTNWPNAPTIAQGFLGGRWQRRDGSDYPELQIPEAPYDNYYYGRHSGGWAQVVEEAPELTARRSVTGWARASFGSDVAWISLDDVLMNYAGLDSPALTGTPTAPTPPNGDDSNRVATTAFVLANGGVGGGGPYLSLSGGQMTGPLITRDGGSLTNPGLAIGDNSTGFYRTGGNLLVTTVSGVGVMQIQPALAAFFISVNFTGKPLNSVGDPVLIDDALNLRTGDARYARIGSIDFLPIAGGTLTGQLVTQSGTGSRDLAIGVGDDTTGLYRQGNSLAFMAQGFPLMLLDGSNRSAAFIGPLNMSGNVIGNIGNPGLGTDALNLQTGDARYLQLAVGGIINGPVQVLSNPIVPNDVAIKGYVDASIAQVRAPTLVYDLPADVPIAGDGAWHELVRVPFVLTRTGISRIQVTLNCNTTGVNNVASIGARLAAGGAERTIFGFGVTPGGESVGFTCNLYFDTSPGAINIPIELTSLVLTGAPAAFTILGGAGPRHSQIVIVDLGPAS